MARKKSGIDTSPEARAERTREKREEMERQGCPFGRYPNGTPRTRPEIPDEMRSKYAVYGVTRGDGSKVFFKAFNSRRKAEGWALDSKHLLKLSCVAVEIVRTKRMLYTEFE